MRSDLPSRAEGVGGSRALPRGSERDAERERDHLAAAVKDVLGLLNYYIGPAARSAIGRETEMQYWRLLLAYRRATGDPCPRCDDTGVDRHYVGAHPCALADAPGHGGDSTP